MTLSDCHPTNSLHIYWQDLDIPFKMTISELCPLCHPKLVEDDLNANL